MLVYQRVSLSYHLKVPVLHHSRLRQAKRGQVAPASERGCGTQVGHPTEKVTYPNHKWINVPYPTQKTRDTTYLVSGMIHQVESRLMPFHPHFRVTMMTHGMS